MRTRLGVVRSGEWVLVRLPRGVGGAGGLSCQLQHEQLGNNAEGKRESKCSKGLGENPVKQAVSIGCGSCSYVINCRSKCCYNVAQRGNELADGREQQCLVSAPSQEENPPGEEAGGDEGAQRDGEQRGDAWCYLHRRHVEVGQNYGETCAVECHSPIDNPGNGGISDDSGLHRGIVQGLVSCK